MSIAEQIFDNAHTTYAFEDKTVSEETIKELNRLTHLAPTAFNCTPIRVHYFTTVEGKTKIAESGMGANKPNTIAAPVVAVLTVDQEWIEKMGTLCPAYGGVEGIKGALGNNEEVIKNTGVLNANIQAGYFILAARSLGLGVGPMTGFDFNQVNAAIGNEKHSAFAVVRLGYPKANPEYKRAARLSFEETAQIL